MPTLYSDLQMDPVTGDLDLTGNTMNLITSNLISLRQRLWIRFSVWTGDWYFNQLFGFPYRAFIAKKVKKSVLDGRIKKEVRAEPDVLDITEFSSTMDVVVRSYTCYLTVTTREGDELNIAFSAEQGYTYPTPSEGAASLCGDDQWVTWQNKLYYLINFRMPVYGDATWINTWAGDVSAPEYALGTQSEETITTQLDQPIITTRN